MPLIGLQYLIVVFPDHTHLLSDSDENAMFCGILSGFSPFAEVGKSYLEFISPSVLPAKSDSDVMFCLQCYQGLILDRSLVY